MFKLDLKHFLGLFVVSPLVQRPQHGQQVISLLFAVELELVLLSLEMKKVRADR